MSSPAGESCFARTRAFDRLRNLFNLFALFGRHHPFLKRGVSGRRENGTAWKGWIPSCGGAI